MDIVLKTKWVVSDFSLMTWRSLIRYVRLPQLIIFSTIQPVMFVLLFTYVFGGAIHIPGISYVDYLLPGILVQATLFGSVQTGVGLAYDLSSGLTDRFNSLPMARIAVLVGRTFSDAIRNLVVISLMIGVGYIVGFRFQSGILDALAAILLIAAFGFSFSWISANIGLLVKETETAQVAGFIWIFPLVFLSSIFVPIKTMPQWLQSFAEKSPITHTVNAARGFVLGGVTFEQVIYSVAWIIGILAIFVPLAVLQFRKTK